MKKLFLDDMRNPWNDTWETVRTLESFKDSIRQTFPSVVSIDHDLHDEHYHRYMDDPIQYNKLYKTFKHPTGVDAMKWLGRYCIDKGFEMPHIFIHSMNPTGKQNIYNEALRVSFMLLEEDPNISLVDYYAGEPKNTPCE